MPGEESTCCKKRHQRKEKRGGPTPCLIRWLLFSSTASTVTLLLTLFPAGASSHLTVPIFDLFTAFTGAESHLVLLVPHRSFLSVK